MSAQVPPKSLHWTSHSLPHPHCHTRDKALALKPSPHLLSNNYSNDSRSSTTHISTGLAHYRMSIASSGLSLLSNSPLLMPCSITAFAASRRGIRNRWRNISNAWRSASTIRDSVCLALPENLSCSEVTGLSPPPFQATQLVYPIILIFVSE